MEQETLKLFRNKLERVLSSVEPKESIIGCTDAQITGLIDQYGELPAVFYHFLKRTGVQVAQYTGNRSAPTQLFYADLDSINIDKEGDDGWVDQMKAMKISVPPNIFIISSHQGYSWLYIVDRVSVDPVVFNFTEGVGIRQLDLSLGDVIIQELAIMLCLKPNM